MSLQTYTVTSASFEAEAGSNISGGANPTVTLVISPAAGYTLTHSNFSIGNALPGQVQSATFSQAGPNVNCLVTFANGFTMPASDVELLIDIDGAANEQTFTVGGNYITSETNTTGTSGTTAFSASGISGQEVTLFTKTFTAAANHTFSNFPFFYQDPAIREQSDYIITYSDTGVGVGKDLILTERTYTVKYIIKSSNETLNNLYFTAEAAPIFSTSTVVSSYKINTNNIGQKPETRQIDFFGAAGATCSLNVTDSGSNNDNYSITLDASGLATLLITFPNNLATGSKTWTFTLSGNIASPFAQTNPFTITQLGT